MTTTMTETWERVCAALEARAPLSADCLRPPATAAELDEAEGVIGVALPAQLRELLLLSDGVEAQQAARLLPPFHMPMSIERLTASWRMKVSIAGEGAGGGHEAGSPTQSFHRLFLPVGDDTTGDLFVVDMRPGRLHGCVLNWSNVDGHFGEPQWESFGFMWQDVALALEASSGSGQDRAEDPHLTRNGCAAVYTAAGALEWEF
ncbi:SMI1/KNR4 family protein [Streptomyces sp. NPDC048491]|uniref:SMI1/KNR4 family protein n=1 Tax=Streptomyces sp. NPDC048491 TaxID=3157207 RepID=UPI0034386286